MLSLKWKIFRIVSYLHMVLTVMLGAIAIQAIVSSWKYINEAEDILGVSLALLCPTTLLANSGINMYLLEKFYPGHQPGRKLRRFSNVLFILTIIVTISALALAGTAFSDMLSKRNRGIQQNMMLYLIATAIAVIGITGCIILWQQVSLRKAIRRNYEASMNKFLEIDQP